MTELVKQIVQCPFCNNVFDDPRVLSCGHTYCMKCITSLLRGGFPVCKLCGHQQANYSGVENISKNLALLQAAKTIQETLSRSNCENCKIGFSVGDLLYCRPHNLFLCLRCAFTGHSKCSTVIEAEKYIADECVTIKGKATSAQQEVVQSKTIIATTKATTNYIYTNTYELIRQLDEDEREIDKIDETLQAAIDNPTTSSIQFGNLNVQKEGLQLLKNKLSAMEGLRGNIDYHLSKKVIQTPTQALVSVEDWANRE